MNGISIINRTLTKKEIEQVNKGFDELAIEEGIQLESAERISFAAMQEDRLIGSCSGLAHKNGEAYSAWFHLTDLFVDKEFRNQSIGSALLKNLEEKIKALGTQHIWLWTSGASSLRFYNRHGYATFAEKENWYSDGSSRIGLRKTIT